MMMLWSIVCLLFMYGGDMIKMDDFMLLLFINDEVFVVN